MPTSDADQLPLPQDSAHLFMRKLCGKLVRFLVNVSFALAHRILSRTEADYVCCMLRRSMVIEFDI